MLCIFRIDLPFNKSNTELNEITIIISTHIFCFFLFRQIYFDVDTSMFSILGGHSKQIPYGSASSIG